MKQCHVTHSLSTRDGIDKSAYNDKLTHLLLVMWCTSGLLSKCHSLPVDYGTRLLITKGTILTNWCHETIYQVNASSMSLTHWNQHHQVLPPWISWQLTCVSLSCLLLAIWSIINCVFMWRHWSGNYLVMSFCKCLSFHVEVTYHPVHLFPSKFSYADEQFDQVLTQKCGNFEKTIIMTSFHDLWCLWFRTCLNNQC